MGDDHADDLLRRALIDAESSAAVALRVSSLPLCDTLTVVFHGRRDLGHDPDLRRPTAAAAPAPPSARAS